MDVIDKANATPLDPDLMKEMLDCLDAMPEEHRKDMLGTGLGLTRFLEERLKEKEKWVRAMVLISFEFRMEALVDLRNRPEYRAWAMRVGKKGEPDFINEVLIETAASEPLIERNKHPAFEPVAFFRRALERADAEGRA
jgi:hypothetical protein